MDAGCPGAAAPRLGALPGLGLPSGRIHWRIGAIAAVAILAMSDGFMAAPANASGTAVMLNAPMPLLDASRPAPEPGTPGFVPAPTPDPDAQPPVRLGSNQPQWDASLRSAPTHALRPGAATYSGSDFSENLQRRRGGLGDGVTPMLSLKMPLQ